MDYFFWMTDLAWYSFIMGLFGSFGILMSMWIIAGIYGYLEEDILI